MNDVSCKKMFARACNYLSRKMRTEYEVRDYLFKTFCLDSKNNEIINKVIDNLKKYSYLNDSDYTALFVKNAIARKGKSLSLLKYELSKKGISEEVINNFFITNTFSDEDTAMNILKRVWHRYKNTEGSSGEKKALQYLQRKGFSFDIALKSLRSMKNQLNIEESLIKE